MVGDNGHDDSLTARIASLEAEIVGLRKAVQTRTVIGQATGLISAVQGCTPQEGFQLLVRMSQHHNVKLHTIALKLLDLSTELGPRQAVRAVHASAEPVPEPADGHVAAPEWPGVEVVNAARGLVAAYDAAQYSGDDRPEVRRQLADQVESAGRLLAEKLTEVGWLIPDPG
ncbi:ANTAR domain-containing protein [Saccharothrix texasensis]|uniref:ANTAR domain-containing protein n=1 Tax=Saccharothrix texasensis TaxID=103734 RepID=A0A3N1HGI9_9PSEU|nr:ANTAR domain-containing protein [Saccharothrix texasensis]ROP41581.1 ANTAR domain-containing protein [Saccharothrix texasensis]